MTKIIQFRLFDEPEITQVERGTDYEKFCKKFEIRKTTDDCYTPPPVYDAVKKWVVDRFKLQDFKILRPFKPGGNYLTETYTADTVVIDNPPFSIYRQIIRNYLRLNVKFFLFAPGLTLFVPDTACQYVIVNSVIRYENGAKVRTSFATNLIPPESGINIIVSKDLSDKIKKAQKQPQKVAKTQLPRGWFNSAQLLKFAGVGNYELEGSCEFRNENDDGRRIFGSAMKLTDNDVIKLDCYE